MSGMKKATLLELSRGKLSDAKLLAGAGRHASAYYLAGYSVELALKAVISTKFEADTFPDPTFVRSIYNHDLQRLLALTGLDKVFETACKIAPDLDANWEYIRAWSVDARYALQDAEMAANLIAAIENETNGFMSWLISYL